MKRLMLPLLVVVLVLAFAVPAMAVKGAPGPPAMMTGSYYYSWTSGEDWGWERVVFRAGGTLEDGNGFIHYVGAYTAYPEPYYLDFEVTSFYRSSPTRAACYAVLKATDTTWPVETTKMVLWLEDNGEGAMAVDPDGFGWVYGPLDAEYTPAWLTDWIFVSSGVTYAVDPISITSGNIQVH